MKNGDVEMVRVQRINFFNLQQIMPREQQETVAKVLISAFLDSTLKEKKNYQKIFQDLGYAKKVAS